DVTEKYDALLVDMFGVVYDGVDVISGVRECLEKWRQLDKQVVFISNAPYRVDFMIANRLNMLGLHQGAHYNAAHSSGEETHARLNAFVARWGARFYGIL